MNEAIRNPEWPHGITLKEYIDNPLYWKGLAECRWCGRNTDRPDTGHDGFCPIPFLFAANETLSRLSAKAKLGLAEIREAKREVMEELSRDFESVSSFTPRTYFEIGEKKGMETLKKLINQRLAALKGEKDGAELKALLPKRESEAKDE